MHKLGKWIRTEWEQALLAGAVVLLLAFWALWAVGFGSIPDAGVGRPAAPTYESVFRESPLALLEPAPAPSADGKSPFSFVIEVEGVRRARRPPEAAPAARKVPEAKPVPRPKPVPKPVPAEVPATPVEPESQPAAMLPPQPEAPVPVRTFTYRQIRYVYSSVTKAGSRVALLQVTDPENKRTLPCTLAVGQQVDGIKVIGFEDDAVIMVDARGHEQRIPFGGSRKLVGLNENRP